MIEHEIDSDEGRDFPAPFFAQALPCESCGEPTYQARIWNAEYQLWVAVDCSCQIPDEPTCPTLVPELDNAVTVREVCQVIRAHRAACQLCQERRPPVIEFPARQEASKEPAIIYREAA